MALYVKTFKKTVTSAGTAEALSSEKLLVTAVTLRALKTNTGDIYIGDSNVSSVDGMFISASEVSEKSARTTKYGIQKHWNLNLIYIDSDVDGEGVVVEYDIEQ